MEEQRLGGTMQDRLSSPCLLQLPPPQCCCYTHSCAAGEGDHTQPVVPGCLPSQPSHPRVSCDPHGPRASQPSTFTGASGACGQAPPRVQQSQTELGVGSALAQGLSTGSHTHAPRWKLSSLPPTPQPPPGVISVEMNN